MKRVITQIKKFQYFYPYTVAIVGAQAGGRTSYMACAWHTALSFDPPLFGVLIAKKRFTHQIVSRAGEFTVNFIGYEKAILSAQMGRKSGHDMDKVEQFQVRLAPARVVTSPVLEDAYVSFECRLMEVRIYGDHDLFVGQVAAIHEQEGGFTDQGVLVPSAVQPLLYLGSDFYVTVDPETLKHVLP